MKKLWIGRALAAALLASAALVGLATAHGTSASVADSQWGNAISRSADNG